MYQKGAGFMQPSHAIALWVYGPAVHMSIPSLSPSGASSYTAGKILDQKEFDPCSPLML
jgi:hypothetical protein